MDDQSYARYAAVLSVLASIWLVVSSVYVRMPLKINWFIRMFGLLLLITTIYTALQRFLVGDNSVIVPVFSIVWGLLSVSTGYLLTWPTTTAWASTLAGGFAVAGTSAYLAYRRVESEQLEAGMTPG